MLYINDIAGDTPANAWHGIELHNDTDKNKIKFMKRYLSWDIIWDDDD